MFPISDALLWGKYINNCIFVSAFGKTRVPLIKTAIKRFAASGIKLLGAVVNMSKFGGLSYSYYGLDAEGHDGEKKHHRKTSAVKPDPARTLVSGK